MDIQKVFLTLVRLGIGHEPVDGLQLTVHGPIDWEAVLALAERQGLSGIVADGIECLPKEARPPKPVMLQLIGSVLQNYEYRHEQYRRAIAELEGFYNSHGFKMMVLKGYACALDWPKPEHRPSGDIDIWLFGEQKAADASLLNANDNFGSSDYSTSFNNLSKKHIEIDNSHHHHSVFYWRNFVVENHYDFINVHARRSNAKLERIFKELGDASNINDSDNSQEFENPRISDIPKTSKNTEGTKISFVDLYGERVYLPSANLHALFLIRHAVAHFAAAEIKLRQVLDWAFFVEKHGDKVDWPWLTGVLEEFGLRRFFDVLNAICVEDLSFVFNDNVIINVDRELKSRVLEDILEPEFNEKEPFRLLPRVWFRFRRWQANGWKQQLCYNESRWSCFWSGVWSHLLKPSSI